MSRMERVRAALTSTVSKLRKDVEETHAKGKIPADYSLGFANGLIFAEHKINMKMGEPIFLDRTTSIGALPKPVALTPKWDKLQGADEIYENLRESVILTARKVAREKDAASIGELDTALKTIDNFVEQMEHAQKEAQVIKSSESEASGSEPVNDASGMRGDEGEQATPVEAPTFPRAVT